MPAQCYSSIKGLAMRGTRLDSLGRWVTGTRGAEDAPVALEQLAAMPPCRVIIFDRPWNRGVPLLTAHFTRCRDWAAVEQVERRQHLADPSVARL